MALVQKTLAELVTISRASGGGRFNSAGQFEWLTASNSPRFDYDPVTLLPRGILIEEQRTNLLTYSSDFSNAAWVKGALTAAVAGVSPDGVNPVYQIAADTTNASHFIAQSISVTTGVTYALTFFAKAGTTNYIQLFGAHQLFGPNAWANYDLVNGVVGTVGSAVLKTAITPIGSGWYRCELVVVATSTGAVNSLGAVPARNATETRNPVYTGAGESVFLYLGQAEQGAFATSPIPTTTAQVTRSADLVDVTSLSPWFNSAEMTIFAEFMTMHSGADNYVFALSDGSSNNAITARQYTGRVTRSSAASGGVSQAVNDGSVIAAGVTAKIALACKQDDFAFADQGTIRWTDVAALMPAGLTSMKLGRHPSSNSQLNGWLRRFRVYPRRELNAKLEEMTA